MRIKPISPVAALLLAGGCAMSGEAQGYDPGYPAPPQGYGYGQGYADNGYGQQAYGEDVPSVEVFYDRLAPYGRWVETRWGRGWQPNVGRDWRPYVDGYWADNRFWVSNEPWGWATYHYGRWGYDTAYGWVWIPGTEWAPSWVAWRDADEYAGWAPIPPGVSLGVGIGFGYGYDNWDSWYAPSWVWVPTRYVYARHPVTPYVVPWTRGHDFWARSRWQPAPNWVRPSWAGQGRPPAGWQGDRDGGHHDDRAQGYRRDGNVEVWRGYPGHDPRQGWQAPGTSGAQPWPRPGYSGRPPVNGSNGSVTQGSEPMPGAVQGSNGTLTPPSGRWQSSHGYQEGQSYQGGGGGHWNGGTTPPNYQPRVPAPGGLGGGSGYTPHAAPPVNMPPPAPRPAFEAHAAPSPPPPPPPQRSAPPARPPGEVGEHHRPE